MTQWFPIGIAVSVLSFASASNGSTGRPERVGSAAQAATSGATESQEQLRAACEALAASNADAAENAARIAQQAADLIPAAADAATSGGAGWDALIVGATALAHDAARSAGDATSVSDRAAACARSDATAASARAAAEGRAQAQAVAAAADESAARFANARSENAGGSSEASDARLRAAMVDLMVAQRIYTALTRVIHVDQQRVDQILSRIIR